MAHADKPVFKVCPAVLWQAACASGEFAGSADDLRDGYIHFSTAAQLSGTLAKHFRGQTGLLLLRVEAKKLGAALKWEPSRGGDLFPHLYGKLSVSLVDRVIPLDLDGDGHVRLPEGPL